MQRVTGFGNGSFELADGVLSRIYSSDFGAVRNKLLLACGGHLGRAAVFSVEPPRARRSKSDDNESDVDSFSEEGDARTLLSWRAHRGWLSTVQFASDSRCLTSSNDGDVCLWDIQSASSMQPRSVTSFSPHNSGIFDAHFFSNTARLATAQKGKACVVSTLRETSFSVVKVNSG